MLSVILSSKDSLLDEVKHACRYRSIDIKGTQPIIKQLLKFEARTEKP